MNQNDFITIAIAIIGIITTIIFISFLLKIFLQKHNGDFRKVQILKQIE